MEPQTGRSSYKSNLSCDRSSQKMYEMLMQRLSTVHDKVGKSSDMGVFPKIGGVSPPKSSGQPIIFIIFTIHFGGFWDPPYFWFNIQKRPRLRYIHHDEIQVKNAESVHVPVAAGGWFYLAGPTRRE